jgi:hypothetical protein
MKALTSATRMPPTRSPGLLTRMLAWLLDLDDVTPEEARRRMRNRSAPGVFASPSPEDLEYFRSYDGPEVHGPPLTRRERRDLERRMASWNT